MLPSGLLSLPLVFSYCPVPRYVGESVTQRFVKNLVDPSGLQSGIVQFQTRWRRCHSNPLLGPTHATQESLLLLGRYATLFGLKIATLNHAKQLFIDSVFFPKINYPNN
ncbi:hypothetical protein AVEN_89050-1 [Araneus ventricosus]|uniref:Uncharacterized protein n=1 Tax=Araneus ventricosus TaxID=182803 RepID=A0A4Y2B3V0_ARAVE|nr:hypothetical protein AVEN_89050-1 [Araneus ventricosus]